MPYAARLLIEGSEVEALASMNPLLNNVGTCAPGCKRTAVTTPPLEPPIEALILPSFCTAPPLIVTLSPSAGVFEPGHGLKVPGTRGPIFATLNFGVLVVSVGS